MAFDFKKEYKEFYMPKGSPCLVDIPEMNYIAVRGERAQMRKEARTDRPSPSCTRLPIPLK